MCLTQLNVYLEWTKFINNNPLFLRELISTKVQLKLLGIVFLLLGHKPKYWTIPNIDLIMLLDDLQKVV